MCKTDVTQKNRYKNARKEIIGFTICNSLVVTYIVTEVTQNKLYICYLKNIYSVQAPVC